MRGLGLPSLLADLLGPVVVVFALVTQLGDAWFLSLLVGLSYWLGPHTPRLGDGIDRRRAAVVVGLLVLSFVLVYTAKPLFGLPRPPGAEVAPRADLLPDALAGVYTWLSTGSGFGFPSGHATSSTLVYGGLAWAVRVGSARKRVAIAAVLAGVVSLSRLVLGLHYLVDVLAGAALALGALGIAVRLATPARVFGLTAAVGVLGLLTAGPTVKLVAGTGVAVGATGAWLWIGDERLTDQSRAGAFATVGVGAVTAAVFGVVGVVTRAVPVVAFASLVGGALIVAMPLVGERVAKKTV